jgi:uroporphyrinogen-III synthase
VLAGEAAARAAAERAAILVVASPSVADLLARVARSGARPRMLAVGPTTAAAARASGWPPAAVADRPDVEALLAGVRSLLAAD